MPKLLLGIAAILLVLSLFFPFLNLLPTQAATSFFSTSHSSSWLVTVGSKQYRVELGPQTETLPETVPKTPNSVGTRLT